MVPPVAGGGTVKWMTWSVPAVNGRVTGNAVANDAAALMVNVYVPGAQPAVAVGAICTSPNASAPAASATLGSPRFRAGRDVGHHRGRIHCLVDVSATTFVGWIVSLSIGAELVLTAEAVVNVTVWSVPFVNVVLFAHVPPT